MSQPSDFNTELQALISLLDEPDQQAFAKVREHICVYGPGAVPLLEQAWENSFDELMQQRIENIIHDIQFEKLYQDLHAWSHLSYKDPLEGFILFTRYHYPHLDEEEIKGLVFKLNRDAWLELNDNLTPLEKIKVLNHIFFDIYKFKCVPYQNVEMRHLFLNNLLETRTGNSHSLGMLYSLIARQLNLPVYGLILPGEKFVMAWVNETLPAPDGQKQISFYINPQNKGGVFTKNEIKSLFRQVKIKIEDSVFQPMNDVAIIDRFFALLGFLYLQSGDPEKNNEIDLLRSALL
ncbi:MAG: transglutaminase family protein [Lentimicrobiaceae bacterium]|nr:transglutaminase family protein [Lentimicrobiaceae bacterium]